MRLIYLLSVVLLASGCSTTAPSDNSSTRGNETRSPARAAPATASQTPSVSYEILARDLNGGWLNLDIRADGDPLEAAKQCVRDHPSPEAVACFAFPSTEARAAAKPESAGNFKGGLCYDARWQRNKMGDESGGNNTFKDPSCPSSPRDPQSGVRSRS